MQYWLVKSEPATYSWERFEKEGRAVWDGVRNYEARNNLRAMKKGDQVLFYHSNEGLQIVGIASVSKEHYPDPTTDDERWLAVEITPLKALKKPVTLAQIKADKRLENMALVKKSRISVTPVLPAEFDIIMSLSGK